MIGGNIGFKTLGFGLYHTSGIVPGTYHLKDLIGSRGDYSFSTIPADRYFTTGTHTGMLTITSVDKTAQIITGTFYFNAYNSYTDDSVKVTEGRFRMKYSTF